MHLLSQGDLSVDIVDISRHRPYHQGKPPVVGFSPQYVLDPLKGVLEVGDGIALIHGLSDAMAGETLEFQSGVMGQVFNLEPNSIGAVVYGSCEKIKERIDRVLADPYTNTELLRDASGKLNLLGCRSVRVDRNFRIIFLVCEECRGIPECEFCFCENLPNKTVVFLTVGPHDKAYAMK